MGAAVLPLKHVNRGHEAAKFAVAAFSKRVCTLPDAGANVLRIKAVRGGHTQVAFAAADVPVEQIARLGLLCPDRIQRFLPTCPLAGSNP